ncbi:MAG: hypothetical protein WB987_12260 [Candidatus Acidiferrales bacterium]
MSKSKTVTILVGLGAVFDLCLSYYRTHSMLGAIVGIVLGLGSTAFFIWIHYKDLP